MARKQKRKQKIDKKLLEQIIWDMADFDRMELLADHGVNFTHDDNLSQLCFDLACEKIWLGQKIIKDSLN